MMKIKVEILKLLFSFLDLFVSQRSYIVFSCRSGKDYADNSQVLYEKFLEEGIDNVYFYTKKKDVLLRIPKNGIYAYSFKTLLILLKSRILIFTHGSSDFYPYVLQKKSNRTFVNLHHGIPIKKIGQLSKFKSNVESAKWDYFIVSSDFEADLMKKCYSLDTNQIKIFGLPRNDVILKGQQKKDKKKRVVLYAPTFRDSAITKLFPFHDSNLKSLDDYLATINTEIMIRIHINEAAHFSKLDEYQHLKNIYFAGSDKYPSINDILPDIDMLITDYSGIVFDFLLLDKPIAYIPYDFKEFEQERGFMYDFYEHTAGIVLSNQTELEKFLSSDSNDFKEKRKQMRDLFHKYQDGKSTQRLFEFINDL